MNTFHLVEPSRGMDILNRGLNIQNKYEWIANLAPTFADVFVVVYPIFLVCIYIYAIIKNKPVVKQGALYVFWATFIAVLINIGIQTFFYKERPIVALNQVEVEETLLHDILPTSSFPSDHAVVSMAVAIAALLRGLHNKRKLFTRSGIFFIIVSLVMTLCRILTLVHWPSDILAGLGLGLIVPLILMIRPIRYMLLKYLINPIIRLEQWIIKKIFGYDQGKI